MGKKTTLTILCAVILSASLSGAALAVEIIVDDQGSGFSRYGTPSYWKEAWIGYNGHMLYTYNGQSAIDNYARWQPNLSSAGPGTYTVSAYIPSNYADTTNATYTIFHNGITDTRAINQAIYSNQWVSLGEFYFSAAGNEYAQLVDKTGESYATKKVGFDAVKWFKADLPPAPTITSPGTSSEPGEVISTLTPTLQWNAVSGADYYAIAIREDPPNGPIVYNPQQVYGTSHVVPSGKLMPGHVYKWNMQAHNSAGYGSVSNSLYFQTPQPLLPDLIVSDIIVAPDPPKAAGYTTITIEIKNQGGSNVVETFLLELYFDGIYQGHVYVNGLGAGSSYTSSWQAMMWPADTNYHIIKGVVDPTGVVNESYEGNNELTKQFRATEPPQGTGTLKIESVPGNADVYVDGVYKGQTPLSGYLTIPDLSAGDHTLKVTKAGYKDWTGTVTIPSGSIKYEAVILEPITARLKPPVPISPGLTSEPGPAIDTLTPTLQWTGVSGADYYALAISVYPYGSSNIVYSASQLCGTSHLVPSGVLEHEMRYRWNMQAHNNVGWSDISTTLYFHTYQNLQPPDVTPRPESGNPQPAPRNPIPWLPTSDQLRYYSKDVGWSLLFPPDFDPNMQTYVLTHDRKRDVTSMSEITAAIAARYPKANILGWDWRSQAACGARKAARRASAKEGPMLSDVLAEIGILPENATFIGHGIGGHLMSSAVANLSRLCKKNISRLVLLDTPMFWELGETPGRRSMSSCLYAVEHADNFFYGEGAGGGSAGTPLCERNVFDADLDFELVYPAEVILYGDLHEFIKHWYVEAIQNGIRVDGTDEDTLSHSCTGYYYEILFRRMLDSSYWAKQQRFFERLQTLPTIGDTTNLGSWYGVNATGVNVVAANRKLAQAVQLTEASDAYIWKESTIPCGAFYLTFDAIVLGRADGDKLIVSFDDEVLFCDSGTLFDNTFWVKSGAIYVGDLAGKTGILQLWLKSEGEPNLSILIDNITLTKYSHIGDLDGDWDADFGDLAILTSHWLEADCNEPNWCEGADIDHSKVVDFIDFSIFADNWLWMKIPADLNIDEVVDFTDYAVFANQWMNQNCVEPCWCDGTDFNKTGQVDILDLAIFTDYWLEDAVP